MDTVLALLTQYGYAGLFVLLMLGIVGLPIPDETLLVFSGYLIFRGRLNFIAAFFSGFLGSVCGISLSYYLGRRFGTKVLTRFCRGDQVDQVHRWFGRIGLWSLAIGYYLPGIRHFTAVVAGMSALPYGKFAAFAYSGAALWVAAFLGLGYLFGERWEHTSALVHRYTLIATACAAAVAAVVWLVRRARVK